MQCLTTEKGGAVNAKTKIFSKSKKKMVPKYSPRPN